MCFFKNILTVHRVKTASKFGVRRTKFNDDGLFISAEKLVPGKPEVVVEQPETAVVVSWTLKEKNGVMKEYHVTYTREDDLSETQTLATKEMEAHFDLKAGKTYEFRVTRFDFLREALQNKLE